MAYLTYTKFFKCTFVICYKCTCYLLEIDFLNIYFHGFSLFAGIFLEVLLIISVMNFAFVNIFYLNSVSFDVDNVKTFNGTYSLTIMIDSFSNYGQEVFISICITSVNTKSLDYILQNLTLISFCENIFCKNRVLNFSTLFISIFVIFLCFCKAPNNSIDFDLKSCSKFEFYFQNQYSYKST